MQKCGDLVGSAPVWGIECFKRMGTQRTDRLGNKLQAENDRGVMFIICSLLGRYFTQRGK